MAPIKIKQARSSDAAAIADLFREITNKELDVKRIKKCIEGYPSALALSDSKLVGFAYTSSFAPDILELLNIAILETYRCSGIGTIILGEIEKQAYNKYNSIILVNSILYPSKKKKELASNFYLKNGYNVIHTTGSTNVFVKSLV